MAEVPSTSATVPVTSGAAPVTDRRPVPRGVMPRGTQTWLMAAVALGMLLVIFVAGRPEPTAPPAAATTNVQAPSPERVRDYQDRLRALDARAAQEAQAAVLSPQPLPPAGYADTQAPPPPTRTGNRVAACAYGHGHLLTFGGWPQSVTARRRRRSGRATTVHPSADEPTASRERRWRGRRAVEAAAAL